MPVSWIEKTLYPVAVWLFYSQGRTHAQMLPGTVSDIIWLVLLVIAWLRTREVQPR